MRSTFPFWFWGVGPSALCLFGMAPRLFFSSALALCSGPLFCALAAALALCSGCSSGPFLLLVLLSFLFLSCPAWLRFFVVVELEAVVKLPRVVGRWSSANVQQTARPWAACWGPPLIRPSGLALGRARSRIATRRTRGRSLLPRGPIATRGKRSATPLRPTRALHRFLQFLRRTAP